MVAYAVRAPAGCKRLHLSFGPSQGDRRLGRAKTQIVSDVRGRGCVRRAGSGRPRAHRRRPRPTVWVVGCESGGLRCRQLTVTLRSKLRRALGSPVVCGSLTFAPNPVAPGAFTHQPSRAYRAHPRSCSESARLQALASEFWPVLGGSIVRTGQKSDRKRCSVSWLRTPRKFQPAPSAQTTSSARSLGGWSRKRGPAVSPAQTDLRSPVVCGTLTFASVPARSECPCSRSPRTPVARGALTRQPSRTHRADPRSCSESARLQALASGFWPVLGGSIVRTG